MLPIRILILSLLAVAVPLAAPLAAGADETFRAQGNEPFWSLRKTDAAITFAPMDGTPVTIAPVPTPEDENGDAVFRASVEGESFVLTIADRVCTDTMSGMPFPARVNVALGADSYDGCGGDPAALLAGDWTVTMIDGSAPVADSEPSLSFDGAAKVSGNASCNRFFGSYTLTGEGLGFGEMGSSMMACADPVRAQERALLDILEATTGFSVADDGTLPLAAADGRSLVASRSVP
mgnify:CR=1 FL=1